MLDVVMSGNLRCYGSMLCMDLRALYVIFGDGAAAAQGI